jgi:hypothetical protein
MAQCDNIIDLRKHRVARLIRQTSVQQAELARTLRMAADDRAKLVDILCEAQRELSRVADSYSVLLDRLNHEREFREDCLAATELDDLEEMVRRRDELAHRLKHLREENRPPVLRESK